MSKLRLNGSTSGYIELEAPAVADNGVLTLPTAAAGFGVAGIGTNVVQTVKTDTFSATTTSFTPVTGLTVTITPSSSSSKVLVVVSVASSSLNNTASDAYRLTRGGSPIAVADSAGSRALGTFRGSVYAGSQVSYTYLDSPATTSATTYGVEVLSWNAPSTAARVNLAHDDVDTGAGYRARVTSSITAIEVAA